MELVSHHGYLVTSLFKSIDKPRHGYEVTKFSQAARSHMKVLGLLKEQIELLLGHKFWAFGG